eukprot:TRINITY_DN396_c5_g1_i1.p1 TRINITY_DN396_c5_g1~~TRINITY_DN396_c5_g1_i1.p1  ORF type:complete len:764 (+),score=215.83 TRINITY_DN396_c5_g1_i1:101-2293(+)
MFVWQLGENKWIRLDATLPFESHYPTGHAVNFRGKNQLLMIGCNSHDNQQKFLRVFVFDFEDHSWTEYKATRGSEIPCARFSHCAAIRTVKNKEMVYVFGGTSIVDNNVVYNDLHVYDVSTHKWSKPKINGELPAPRSHAAMTIVGRQLYLFGGYNPLTKEQLKEWNVLNLDSMTWTKPRVGGVERIGRNNHTLTTVGTDIFIFGGRSMEKRVAALQSLNTRTMEVRNIILKNEPQHRSCHGGCLFHEGDIGYFHIMGGYIGKKTWASDLYQLTIQGQQTGKGTSSNVEPPRKRSRPSTIDLPENSNDHMRMGASESVTTAAETPKYHLIRHNQQLNSEVALLKKQLLKEKEKPTTNDVLEDLKADNARLKNDLLSLKGELSRTKEDLSRTQNDLNDTNTRLADTETQKTEIETKLIHSESATRDALKSVEDIRLELVASDQRVKTSENKNKQTELMLKSLEEELNQSKHHLSTLQVDLDRSKADFDSAQGRIIEITRERDIAMQNVSKLDAEQSLWRATMRRLLAEPTAPNHPHSQQPITTNISSSTVFPQQQIHHPNSAMNPMMGENKLNNNHHQQQQYNNNNNDNRNHSHNHGNGHQQQQHQQQHQQQQQPLSHVISSAGGYINNNYQLQHIHPMGFHNGNNGPKTDDTSKMDGTITTSTAGSAGTTVLNTNTQLVTNGDMPSVTSGSGTPSPNPQFPQLNASSSLPPYGATHYVSSSTDMTPLGGK